MNDATAERMYNGLDTRADALMVGCTLGVLISSSLISENIKEYLSKYLMVIAPFFYDRPSCLFHFLANGKIQECII